jgi:HD-GYP domain-containing protein (c-di-GMP phosphodiesterase class II)
LLHLSNDSIESLIVTPPDVLFISCTDANRKEKFDLCQRLRESGYDGIIILFVDDISEFGDTASITSSGFDNYLLKTDSDSRHLDNIHWGILNRRRRNKFKIQFDNNPDMFFTVDGEGRVYDLNRSATEGSTFTPKEVVNSGIHISSLGTLSCFEKVIRPLIREDNIGKVFSETVDHVESVSQLRIKIHNVPTIGLVATVANTDITKTMYSHTLDILVNSVTLLSQRDMYTADHSSRVFYYCIQIAEKLGMAADRIFIRDLYFAAILHDVGKIGVRDDILLKPGKLTKEEFNELATHPVKAYDLLQPYSFLKGASELARFHHERADGKGYPDKLMGNEIPLGAFIIAVADSFDAMTTARPYRNSLPYEKAVSEIKENLGTQYDKEVGKAFLSIVSPSLHHEIRRMSSKPLSVVSQELLSTIIK